MLILSIKKDKHSYDDTWLLAIGLVSVCIIVELSGCILVGSLKACHSTEADLFRNKYTTTIAMLKGTIPSDVSDIGERIDENNTTIIFVTKWNDNFWIGSAVNNYIADDINNGVVGLIDVSDYMITEI